MKKYTIKPLGWVRIPHRTSHEFNVSSSAFGTVVVSLPKWKRGKRWHFYVAGERGSCVRCQTRHEAFVLAEQWYLSRLTAALVEVKEEA